MKYFIFLVLFTTSLFSAQKYKTSTIYGTVTLHVVNSKSINDEKHIYIMKTSLIDNKSVYQRDIQLIFNPKKINIQIPNGQLYANYKLIGHMQPRTYKDGNNFYTPFTFKVDFAKKIDTAILTTQIQKITNQITSNHKIKVKAKDKGNGVTYTKMLINHPMTNEYIALNKKMNIDYLTNIKASVDNKTVLNMHLNGNVSRNPFLKFKYKSKNLNNSEIIVTCTDNTNNSFSKKIKIKGIKNKPASGLDKNNTPIKDKIKIIAPTIAENGGAVPISIISNIDAKSVTLFSLSPSTAKLEKTAQWLSTPYSIIDYAIKIKMRKSFDIKVVIEDKNGKLYTATKYIEISVGGGN